MSSKKDDEKPKTKAGNSKKAVSAFFPLCRKARLGRRLQVRISDEDFSQVLFFATQRREKIGTLTSGVFRTLADLIRSARRHSEKLGFEQLFGGVGPHNPQMHYEFRIKLNGREQTFWGQIGFEVQCEAIIIKEIDRIQKWVGFNRALQFLDSVHPDLGVSPRVAIYQRRLRETKRILRRYQLELKATSKDV